MSPSVIMSYLVVPHGWTPATLFAFPRSYTCPSSTGNEFLHPTTLQSPQIAQEPPMTGVSCLFMKFWMFPTVCSACFYQNMDYPILYCLVYNLTLWIVFSASIILHSLLASNLSSCSSFWLKCFPPPPYLSLPLTSLKVLFRCHLEQEYSSPSKLSYEYFSYSSSPL